MLAIMKSFQPKSSNEIEKVLACVSAIFQRSILYDYVLFFSTESRNSSKYSQYTYFFPPIFLRCHVYIKITSYKRISPQACICLFIILNISIWLSYMEKDFRFLCSFSPIKKVKKNNNSKKKSKWQSIVMLCLCFNDAFLGRFFFRCNALSIHIRTE